MQFHVAEARSDGGVSPGMCALSWHLSAHSKVIRCNLSPRVFTVDWNSFHLSVLLGMTIQSLINSSESRWTASLLTQRRQPLALVYRESLQVTLPIPAPRRSPDAELRCREALVLHAGNEPAVLTLPAPPSAQIGYIFRALPSFHPGVLFSSLDGNPCRVGAVWGWRGGGVLMKLLTQP